MGHCGPVSDFHVVYLDSIDERLLDYLDDDDELKLDVVQRIRFHTSAPLDGSITAEHVWDDWADWYVLVRAFVATYSPEELKELEGAAVVLEAIEEQDDVSLTEADRTYARCWKRGSTYTPRSHGRGVAELGSQGRPGRRRRSGRRSRPTAGQVRQGDRDSQLLRHGPSGELIAEELVGGEGGGRQPGSRRALRSDPNGRRWRPTAAVLE